MARRILLSVAKIVGGIAAVVFFFCPLNSAFQVFLLIASLVVAVGCGAIYNYLDDSADAPGPVGYWPLDPKDSLLYRAPNHQEHQDAASANADEATRP
jgi:hypothetical protein